MAGAQPHQCAQGCQHQVSLGRVQQLHQQPHTVTLEDFLCSSLFSCQHDQVLRSLGKENSVWVTAAHCAQGTGWQLQAPTLRSCFGEHSVGSKPTCPGSTTEPPLAQQHQSSPPLLPATALHPTPRAQTFCFLSSSFSSRSNKIWNICSTFESVQDMVFICNRAEKVAQSSPPSPATGGLTAPRCSHTDLLVHAAAQGTQGLLEGLVPGLQAHAPLQVTDSLVQAAQLLQRLAAAEQRLHIPAVSLDGCTQGGLSQSPWPAPACPHLPRWAAQRLVPPSPH